MMVGMTLPTPLPFEATGSSESRVSTRSGAESRAVCSCGDPDCDPSFDRSLCACGAMHYYGSECGNQLDCCDDCDCGGCGTDGA